MKRSWYSEFTDGALDSLQQNPRWVRATWVRKAKVDGIHTLYVDVEAEGETFRNYGVEWSVEPGTLAKSIVDVRNARGEWLRIWFYDKDINPPEENKGVISVSNL